ncbi:MAG: prolyl oligopeptidase family serine peptidase, partial [Candidatus Cloacimonetes bacterium]|nr:prolyl oligopeptidase family serine peptidase [Candidatus Cloacimonadota bacterium]
STGVVRDRLSAGYNARSLVHEYGGGSYCVENGWVFFVNYQDQDLYVQKGEAAPERITDLESMRFAEPRLDKERQRLLVVVEDLSQISKSGEPENYLGSVNLKSGQVSKLFGGADFYSSAQISPSGHKLAFISWNHPNMPWDGTELWVGTFDLQGGLTDLTSIAGGNQESVFQPQWGPDGSLFFVSDRSGWWNLYRWDGFESTCLCCRKAEFGVPQWVLGLSTYSILSASELVCAFVESGYWQLAKLEVNNAALQVFELPYTVYTGVQVAGKRIVCCASSPLHSPELIEISVSTGATRVIKKSVDLEIPQANVSEPEAISFTSTSDGIAYAWYYPPKNAEYCGPDDELPPLLVISHGGPTSSSYSSLDLKIQFWTSRGFAVLDVNYRGSTGYGRRYREALYGQWGKYDCDDCIAGAQHLVASGRVDPNRLAIRGGSAGGYTTLCALTFHNMFRAGASYYGVGDLKSLIGDCPKFESRSLENLIGPYPAAKELYEERSPLNYCDQLNSPMIFFQGLEDKIVPPNQSEMMVAALRRRAVPVGYIPFEGEQHGFRCADNNRRALEAELWFYGQVFGFEPADSLETVDLK